MKKFLSLVASAFMMFSLVAMPVRAEDNVAYDLPEAIDGVITLTQNVELTTAKVINSDTIVNLNGFTISVPNDTAGDGVFHVTGGTLTINGDGTINGVGNNNYNMAIWADGGNVVINGGYYTNVGAQGDDPDHFDLIYVKNGGSVIINSGLFHCETPKWTLNSHDTSKGTFIVNGGDFIGYNPAESETENPIANFVADGFSVNVDGNIYTVLHAHDLEYFDSVEATCIKAGNIEYWYCESCDQYFADNEAVNIIHHDDTVISQLDHNYGTDYICTECGKLQFVVHMFPSTKFPTNQDIIMTIRGNQPFTIDQDGWTYDEENFTYTKVYTENTDRFELTATNAEGDFSIFSYMVTNIDKVPPTAEVFYSTTEKTEGEVVVTIKANGITEMELEGWKNDPMYQELTKTFTENGEEIVVLKDRAGNEIEVFVKVDNIVVLSPEVEIGVEDLPTVDATKPVEEVTVGVDKEETEEVLNTTVEEIIENITSGEAVVGVSSEVATVISNAIKNEDDIAITTNVEVKPVKEEDVAEKTVALIAEEAGEATVVQYLDLSVLMNVEVNGVAVVEDEEVTQLAKPMTFTIAIPEELKEVEEGYTRTYFIIRVHEGETEKLPVKVNKDGTLSFSTDKFSNYALAYEDTLKVSTQTGDNAPVMMYAGIAMLSMAAMVVLKKKELF